MSRKARKQKCNKYRKSKGDNYLRVIEGGAALHRIRNTQVTITPRNFHQDDLLGYLENPTVDIIFAVGPAGTGKTIISTLAGIKALKGGDIDKFVVTRPAVSVDEQHGFLPGTLMEKMAPWTRPIFDVFEEYYSPEQIEYMINYGNTMIFDLFVCLLIACGNTFINSALKYYIFDLLYYIL